jgi:DNA-directed RNA polymerase subunit RPC12/RpoP
VSKPIVGGTEISCPTCGSTFVFSYSMVIKMSEFKCSECGTALWETAMQDAREVK